MQFLARMLAGSPLRHAPFRLFYFGSIGVALGYTMQATVSAWLMATLTPSALMVALVQTASTVPTLLFGLPAGALADIVDRRRVILVTQIVLLVTTALIGVVTLAGAMGPVTLLLLTFVIGSGFTFYMPAQQASINDLVVRDELSRAVAQNAVAFNVARAIGPALAGAIAAWASSGSALLLSSLFFVAMIASVRRWRGVSRVIRGVPETLVSGMLSGLRYTRHTPPLRAIIVRNVSFALCASSLWALLPVIARDQLGLGAGGYGLLSASFGIGAITGALSLPRQMARRSLNTVVGTATVLGAAAILLLALTEVAALAVVATFCAGASWVSVFASLAAGTQSAAPA
jgi:MFS family permease